MKRKNGGMGTHQSRNAMKTEWLTPPWIIEALGQFDLDPCSPIERPFPTALHHLTIEDDGLQINWGHNRVWCNPPYDDVGSWMEKLFWHGNGIALIFARTDTDTWTNLIWPRADAILFLGKRITFYHVNGEPAKANAAAPSALIAFGLDNVKALKESGLKGKFINLKILNTLSDNHFLI